MLRRLEPIPKPSDRTEATIRRVSKAQFCSYVHCDISKNCNDAGADEL
ncbi:MAG: hypothetical protein ACKVS6_16025 [Planctomycetota bacterium]